MSEAQATRALQQFLNHRGNLHDVTCRIARDSDDTIVQFEDADWYLNLLGRYDGANPALLTLHRSHVLCDLIDDIDDIWIGSFYVSELIDGTMATLITNDGKAYICWFDGFEFTAKHGYAEE